MNRLLQALGLTREPKWGEPQPMPPEIAAMMPDFDAALTKAATAYADYQVTQHAIEVLKAKLIEAMHKAMPDLEKRSFKWDSRACTIQAEIVDPTPPNAGVTAQPPWAKQLADDLNKQVAEGTFTPEARNGSHD